MMYLMARSEELRIGVKLNRLGVRHSLSEVDPSQPGSGRRVSRGHCG